MIVDSNKLDGGNLGRRFLSNFLQILRKYAYQQACPYVAPNGVTIKDQCASGEKWHQPDWVQPDAANVTQQLSVAAGWPVVKTTFKVSAPLVDPRGYTNCTQYRSKSGCSKSKSHCKWVDGKCLPASGPSPPAPPGPPSPPPSPSEKMSYTVNGGPSKIASLPATLDIPFGAIVAVSYGSQNRIFIADAAFDWNAKPPIRRPEPELSSLAITIAL